MNPAAHPSLTSRRRFLQQCGLVTVSLGAGQVLLPAWAHARQLAEQSGGKQLLALSEDPYNAEPQLAPLVADWLTPYEHFYVRNHGNMPAIDASQYRLQVEGLVNKPLSLSLVELQEKFPKQETTATLTCAGNRRNEFEKKVGGVQWQAGAIGNAVWAGALLADVLRAAEVQTGARHVWFEGLDEVNEKGKTFAFGGSIPIEKAMPEDKRAAQTLVAYDMNGKPLSREHGAPLRSLVPGFIGARSVKWLGKIVVSDRPSPNHFLRDVYKLVTEDTPAAAQAADPIYEFALNCAMVPREAPKRGDRKAGLRGYALPTGASDVTIDRVEISSDDGKTWARAQLEDPSQAFCWRLWHAEVPLTPETRHLLARAVDSKGQVQPATMPWNLKGYMYNAYYRLPIAT